MTYVPKSSFVRNARAVSSATKQSRLARMAEYVGAAAVSQSRKTLHLMGLASTVAASAVQPQMWPRTVRNALARSIVASGVDSLGIICFLGAALGVLFVVQYQVWVGNILQSRLLAPALVAVVVRELGPLLVNLVVIARSGNAIATEIGIMQVFGETRVLEGQGLDTVHYIVVPRVLGLIISTCILTVFFMAVSFLGVYLCGQWVGAKTGSIFDFAQSVLAALSPRDIVNLSLKSTISPMFVATMCCIEGFAVGNTIADVPRAASRAVQRSIIILLIVSACISIGTYL